MIVSFVWNFCLYFYLFAFFRLSAFYLFSQVYDCFFVMFFLSVFLYFVLFFLSVFSSIFVLSFFPSFSSSLLCFSIFLSCHSQVILSFCLPFFSFLCRLIFIVTSCRPVISFLGLFFISYNLAFVREWPSLHQQNSVILKSLKMGLIIAWYLNNSFCLVLIFHFCVVLFSDSTDIIQVTLRTIRTIKRRLCKTVSTFSRSSVPSVSKNKTNLISGDPQSSAKLHSRRQNIPNSLNVWLSSSTCPSRSRFWSSSRPTSSPSLVRSFSRFFSTF